MKKIFTSLCATAIAISAFAEITGDGYYRVKNYKTDRYIYVLDNKGSLNFQSQTAELGAIEVWKGDDKEVSDPATIINVNNISGGQYNLQTQGTGVQEIINHPVNIRLMNQSKGIYAIFGSYSGVTKYIGDATIAGDLINRANGALSTLNNGDNYRWYFNPLTTDDNSEYFGILPELTDGTAYYSSLYADFPFSTHSAGMTVYTVSQISNGTAYIKEVTGTVAGETPVIIKCSSDKPSGNKLNIGGTGSAVSDNKLKGVYFNINKTNHHHQTANNKATMRVLGKLADGSIGFVTSDEAFLPRNRAYLVVPEGTPSELNIKLAEAGIDNIAADSSAASICINGRVLTVDGAASAEVYNVTGQLIIRANGNGASTTLPAPGIYIVKAGSTTAKVLAR